MNPGKTTNFLYKISGLTLDDLAIERINNISVTRGTKKIADVKGRVSEVTKLGGELVFKKVVHPVFRANLNLIDSQLSGIAGGLLSSYFSSKGGSLAELTEQIEEDNPLGFDNSHGHKFYDYKVKRLLTDSALGMLPSKVWNGQFEANGGYIVLKQDGEILCYHLYEKDLFENYLFLNTKMDTPSATRYDYGYLFREGDEVLIKLCLQIRFKN